MTLSFVLLFDDGVDSSDDPFSRGSKLRVEPASKGQSVLAKIQITTPRWTLPEPSRTDANTSKLRWNIQKDNAPQPTWALIQ